MNAPDTSEKKLLRRHDSGGSRSPAPNAIIVIDGKKKVRTLTGDAERLTGTPADRLLNQSYDALPAALRKIVHRVLTSGKPVGDRHIKASGRIKTTMSVNAAPLQSGKRGSGVALVLSDTSNPCREFEENIRRLERLASVGTLSASMTHEIKNAFVAVKTFIELQLGKNPDQDLADVVRREIHRVDSLVSHTLKFGGPARPEFSTSKLHDLLDYSLRVVQPLLQSKSVNVGRSFTDAPDSIKGDDFQLEQAFVNLFMNAIEAMGHDGSLSVTTDAIPVVNGSSGLRVTIADTGMGITPENMKHLFEPFFTTKENGTGLGLSITRRIVEEHGGSIRVHSEVRKGTTFTIILPAHSHVL